jgi:hypothetical protein
MDENPSAKGYSPDVEQHTYPPKGEIIKKKN